VNDRHDLRFRSEIVFERLKIEPVITAHPDELQNCSRVARDYVPRDKIAVMLHLAENYLVAFMKVVQPHAYATRFSDSVAFRVNTIDSDFSH